MDAIGEYGNAKWDLAKAKKWEALIGSPYSGGGGGIGKVASATVKMEIYHQRVHGSANYHAPPGERLTACIGLVVTQMGPEIIAKAIAMMERGLVQKAAAAKVLMDAIVADASV